MGMQIINNLKILFFYNFLYHKLSIISVQKFLSKQIGIEH